MDVSKMKKGEFLAVRDELWRDDDFAEICEISSSLCDTPNTNGVRFYKSSPGTFTLQFRTHKSITDMGKGKPRNMVAHAQLTVKDLERLLAYAKKDA